MKTSKVKTIHSVKEYNSGRGTIYYHNLELENGDKINLGKKKQQQVGWNIYYEILDTDGQHEFAKSKAVAPPEDVTKSVGSKDDLILRQVAFKGAIEVLCNYNLEDDDQHVYDTVKDLTNKFHEILKQ